MINKIVAIFASAALCLGVGFGAGYYTKAQFYLAEQTKQLNKVAKKSAGNVIESVEKSQAIEADIKASDDQINAIQDAVAKRLAKPKGKSHDATHPSNITAAAAAQSASRANRPVCPDDSALLDVGTVRLLNAARADTSLDAASISAD